MKCHNIDAYLIIPLALFSIMSLFDNIQAQTNSSSFIISLFDNAQAQTNSSSFTNQTTSQQQQQQQPNQNTNLIAQALMKTDIVELMNNLQKAQLAIADDNLQDALKEVRDVETELLLIEPSPPTKFLNDIGKAIKAIDKSNFDKSLDTLTKIQVSILKAQNLILKSEVANNQPQEMQQFKTLESNTNADE